MLQFVRSYSEPSDVGVKGPSAFELFVVGKAKTEEGIEKPYGVSIYDGKIYVCDVSRRMVEVLDLKNHTFGYLTKDRRLMNPINIFIEDDGTKYIADPTAGGVFIFDKDDNFGGILGKDLKISPIDVVVRGRRCYVADSGSNQVIVFDLITQKEILRMGKQGSGIGEFEMIGSVTIDAAENVYVTDKSKGELTKFDKSGIYQTTIGKSGDAINEFVRPKGIEIDREGRLWIIDAATDVGKVYAPDGEILTYFGLPGNKPGMMNLPAEIKLDYDNIELFRDHIAPGADIEFMVLVTNQYGLHKVGVYAFGSFPIQEKEAQEEQRQWELERKKKLEEKLGVSEEQQSEPSSQ
ncbi:MAG: 6-bladed beta-propeller [Phycisphaerae bacterium]|nr:6-bladed beta-propeller [Phycisphaerae bacterium]